MPKNEIIQACNKLTGHSLSLYLWWWFCRFLVDDTPIRTFRNNEALGVPYMDDQGVGIYASLWDGSNWATDNGWVKLNWTYAPFIATFEDFGVDGCEVVNGDTQACVTQQGMWWNLPQYQTLNANQIQALHKVQSDYLIYDYCTDTTRYPITPIECALNWYELDLWSFHIGIELQWHHKDLGIEYSLQIRI